MTRRVLLIIFYSSVLLCLVFSQEYLYDNWSFDSNEFNEKLILLRRLNALAILFTIFTGFLISVEIREKDKGKPVTGSRLEKN